MTFSNITFETTVLNAICIQTTSGFGLFLYLFVFIVIFSNVAKFAATSTDSTNERNPTDIIFVSFGLNDCIILISYIVAAMRASIKEITVKPIYIDISAFISMASRICKRYHLLFLLISRLIAMRYPNKQYKWLSRVCSAVILLSIWIVSYLITIPILQLPTIDYAIRDFAFHIRNADSRNLFFIEETITTIIIFVSAVFISGWMIKKYVIYRKPTTNNTGDDGVFVITATVEVSQFLQEARKSITTLIMIGFYFVSAVCSWIFAKDDGGDETTKRNDDMYLIRYIFGVYIWCFNSALPPTIFIVVDEVLQKILARFFEKKNQVTPINIDNDMALGDMGPMHFGSETASAIMVFPLQDLNQPSTSKADLRFQGSVTPV